MQAQWEQLVDKSLMEKMLEAHNGAILYDFLRNWPSGKTSFKSAEWRNYIQTGYVIPKDVDDISAKIQ